MDGAAWVAAVAAAISVGTFLLQFWLMRRQLAVAQQEVDASAFIDLMNEFRNMSFHTNYRFVTEDLQRKHDPSSAIPVFDLPDDDQVALIDIVYFFQNCAAFCDYQIVSEQRMMTFLHPRFCHVWDAVKPYVIAERERMGPSFLSALESYASEARKRSAYEVHQHALRSRGKYKSDVHGARQLVTSESPREAQVRDARCECPPADNAGSNASR